MLISILFFWIIDCISFKDKEKQLDSGTPENEKDATTEKESKEGQNDEKEAAPVTNGDSELKEENGDSVPTPEDGKKPKKEKVYHLISKLCFFRTQ